MTSPLPPEIILPSGQTAWLNPYSASYTTNRTYALRMQRGYAAGLTQSQARRGRAYTAGVETQRRRERTQAATGLTPWQLYTRVTFNQRYPNIARAGGYSWYRKLYNRYLKRINDLSSPDLQWGPADIEQQLANEYFTGHDTEWVEQRLAGKLYAMEAYRNGDRAPGYQMFQDIDYMAPVEWWWYH